ncbi:hypothetical protein [Kribbella italica]|uniref:Uncharacterized protein n=1 Tax=Kribbella italica TaxID=1540520 RepID=A0A7W9JBP3_9ACTN|nr:hypothetical protein [Kribbella italica]MBB5839201.1 hypothetical protein [Kribbella italica]
MSYPPPPPPLNYAPYGGPPKKNRAGLVIVLLIGVVVACVGAAGYIAYDLASSRDKEPKATEQADSTPVAPPSVKPTAVKPSVVKPTVTKPTVKPKPPLSKAQQAAVVARTFVGHLNADRRQAAGALACAVTFIPDRIGTLVGPPTRLTIGRVIVTPSVVVYQLAGRTKGKPATGSLVIQIDDKPCVQLVQVTTVG